MVLIGNGAKAFWSSLRNEFMQKQATFIHTRAVNVGSNLKLKWLNREIKDALMKKRIFYKRGKASGNFREWFHFLRWVKTLVKAVKCDKEKRGKLLCMENSNKFFSYVNNWKQIFIKINPFYNTNGSLNFSNKENTVLLDNFFQDLLWKMIKTSLNWMLEKTKFS